MRGIPDELNQAGASGIKGLTMTRLKERLSALLTGCFLLFSLVGCSPGGREDLIIFAAASTMDVMRQVADSFAQSHDVDIQFSPASSGTLARQIESGAEADIYVSASQDWMDYVIEHASVEESGPLVSNSLVLVVPAPGEVSPDATIEELMASLSEDYSLKGWFALGDPQHVPAGVYGKEALSSYGLYQDVSMGMIATADVAAALRLVRIGEASAGIVYQTDALRTSDVTIAYRFPEASHRRIVSYAANLSSDELSNEFYRFLMESDEAKAIYRTAGFTVVR